MRERDTMHTKLSRRTLWTSLPPRLQHWAIDLSILTAFGLLMGFIGPFGSDRFPTPTRYSYWLVCMVGGGIVATIGDQILRFWLKRDLVRVLLGSVILTPFVTLVVLLADHWVMGGQFDAKGYTNLLWQVWPILLAVLVVQALIWRSPDIKVETRTIIAPPLPEAEAAFRQRLSARRRHARLLAIEAHDHYLKVHTDAGEELITLRLSDALEDLKHAHGWQVHRSWWVAADAVEAARWRRSSGEITLAGGLNVPVSRTYSPILKEAGWL